MSMPSCKLFCLIPIFSCTVFSQPLYESDYWRYNTFNTDSLEVNLQVLLENAEVRLKVTESNFEECRIREDSTCMSTSYKNLMKMLMNREVPKAIAIQEACRDHPHLVFSHPTECQLYYNCSVTYATVPTNLEQHMVECAYPSLFSKQSLQCENFTEVCCGLRKEFKDKCEYRMHSGGTSLNQCMFINPSCKGKRDGYQYGKQSIDSFIICFRERLLKKGICEKDTLWNIYKIVYNGKCTNPFEVPYKEGGFLSSCEGKADGNYRFEHDSSYRQEEDYFGFGRQCDAFYRCKEGVATAIKCPKGTVFESVSRSCKPGNQSIELGCQLYCNPDFSIRYNGFPNNLAECPYPKQFSDVTHRCENFTKVTCGSRPQVKDHCRYWFPLYMSRHNGPCQIYHVSCKRLPDGINEHPIKSPGPHYLLCLQGRVIIDGTCKMDTEWAVQTFPFNGKCTQRFALPYSYHGIGYLPDCSRKVDGHYQYSNRPCDAYYKCEKGSATAVKCPGITVFDKRTGQCKIGARCSYT